MKKELEQPLIDDAKNWGGWAHRHGGVMGYFGDWLAGESGDGTNVTTVVVVLYLFFAGLMAALLNAGFARPAKIAPRKPQPVARRKAAR
jgi:hypothetical protein